MVSVESICEQASELPEDQRWVLVHRLLAAVEPAPNGAMDALWDKEIRSRIARYDAGGGGARPAEEVFAEADRRFGK